MHRRRYLALAGCATSAVLGGCTALGNVGDDIFGGDEYDIGMDRNAFRPATYEVSVGDTVVWNNTSEAEHTITALEASLPDGGDYFATGGYDDEQTARTAWQESRGGGLGTRDTYAHTFETPGSYDYICIPHVRADMVGTIVVTA